MSDFPVSPEDKRLVGNGEVDPAYEDGKGFVTKTVVGKDEHVDGPIKSGEGGGGPGGGSPGELAYPPDPFKNDSPDDQAILNRP